MKACRVWPVLEILALDARTFHLKKKKAEIRDESGTKQKDEIATTERAGPLQLLVLSAILLSFTTSLTQPIALFFEHVRLSVTLIA